MSLSVRVRTPTHARVSTRCVCVVHARRYTRYVCTTSPFEPGTTSHPSHLFITVCFFRCFAPSPPRRPLTTSRSFAAPTCHHMRRPFSSAQIIRARRSKRSTGTEPDKSRASARREDFVLKKRDVKTERSPYSAHIDMRVYLDEVLCTTTAGRGSDFR